jgi:hypothetical protein
MHRARLLALLTVAFAPLLLWAPVAKADDAADLDKLLNGIPEVKNGPDPAAEARAAEAERLAQEELGSLPAYIKACRRAVFDLWQPPAKSLKKAPKAKTSFLVSIGDDGSILSVRAGELSGDKKFDQSGLDAIGQVTKFPVPPPGISIEAERGILIELPAKAALARAAGQ